MNLLTVDHITKVYTQRELFHDASFYLQDGEKVGIIGINGTGKSTLLKIMAGLEEPDAGNVVRANHLVIRYLPQMPEFDPQKGALENVLSYAQIGSVHQQEDREEHEKWNLESNAKSMMTRLGIYNFDEPVGHLSGGQRKRLALVAVLLTPCDVLLLDEPTNHLDAEMAEWLENYLKNYRGAMVMVTHDRDRKSGIFWTVYATGLWKLIKDRFTAMRQTIPDILRPNRRGKTLPGQANGKDSPFCARKSNGCSAGQGRVPPNRKHISSAMRPCGIKKSRMLIKRSKSVRCPPVWEKQPWNYHISQKHMEIMY